MHRSFIIIAIAAFFALNLAVTAEVKRPNIVFILIDDMGWADPACYGSQYHLTPNIDALAADGMRFIDAYAACPVCSPTRASILTGKYPARLGITDWIGAGQQRLALTTPPNVGHLPLSELTLAEALKESGYATSYFGKWHLGGQDTHQPQHQGFDFTFGVNRAGQPSSYFFPYNRQKPAPSDVPDLDGGKPGDYLTDELSKEAARHIERMKDKPFFLYLAHYSVHTPIQAQKDAEAAFEKRRSELGLPAEAKSRAEKYGTTRISQNNAAYAAMVKSVDDSVGRIVAKLDELHLREKTIIIFTSDNGGLSTLDRKNFGPSCVLPLRAGKGWVYEGGIRIPMIVSWPGTTKPGSQCAIPVTSTDFYPSILEMTGTPLRPKQHVDGISLVPALKGAASLKRDAIYWHYPHYHGSASRPSAAMRQGNMKLVRWYETGEQELYDLSADISETKNLATSHPDILSKMSAHLDGWLKESGAQPAVKSK